MHRICIEGIKFTCVIFTAQSHSYFWKYPTSEPNHQCMHLFSISLLSPFYLRAAFGARSGKPTSVNIRRQIYVDSLFPQEPSCRSLADCNHLTRLSLAVMAPKNIAAWQTAPKVPKFVVKEAPYTSPAASEIVVKNGAVAINIVDWVLQAMGPDLFNWITYPQILGNDLAGEVVEVGSGVTRFKPGDRVVAHAINLLNNKASEGAFQLYTVVPDFMAAPIPDSISYEAASVLPLGISTAACGLYQKDHLALGFPTEPAAPSTGKALLVWGGASSVGLTAVQLARASGYDVIAVASPKNFDLLKKLGASQVFDYHDADIVPQLVAAFNGKTSAGALSVATGSLLQTAEVISKVSGSKFVSSANPVTETLPEGIASKFIFGGDLRNNEVGPAVYVQFLGKALAAGTFLCVPEAVVVGKGLEAIQEACDLAKAGNSARKLVVSL
jgi:NADPH:quinone reductase-like Zn-dependent oxidoreductase